MKLIKWVTISCITITVLIFISLETIYFISLKEIEKYLILNDKIYSEKIMEIQWVDAGGIGEMKVISISPLSYTISFFMEAYNRDFTNPNRIKYFPPSIGVSSRSVKAKLYNKKIENWHLSNIVATIWASRNWSAKQSLSEIIDSSYYGYGKTTLEEASSLYFSKSVTDLDINEIVTLIAITKSPAMYHPFCYSDRFEKRAKYLQNKLNKNWPDKYGNYVYSFPYLEKPPGISCK